MTCQGVHKPLQGDYDPYLDLLPTVVVCVPAKGLASLFGHADYSTFSSPDDTLSQFIGVLLPLRSVTYVRRVSSPALPTIDDV